MAEERNYVVPLRRYWRMAARYKRAKRAVNGLRKFVMRHMKVTEVKIGKELNELILERGQRKPPARVQVTIVKEDSTAKVNLVGIPYSKEVKKEEKKKLLEKASEKEEKQEKPLENKEEKKSEKAQEEIKGKTEIKEEAKPKRLSKG